MKYCLFFFLFVCGHSVRGGSATSLNPEAVEFVPIPEPCQLRNLGTRSTTECRDWSGTPDATWYHHTMTCSWDVVAREALTEATLQEYYVMLATFWGLEKAKMRRQSSDGLPAQSLEEISNGASC